MTTTLCDAANKKSVGQFDEQQTALKLVRLAQEQGWSLATGCGNRAISATAPEPRRC